MAEAHESFLQPQADVKIWRYMDIAKYLALLQRRALYFARSDLLGDDFEGSTPEKFFVELEEIIANKSNHPAFSAMSDDEIRKTFTDIGGYRKELRKHTFISCWHMNEHESAAMWRLYSKSDESICIQTSYSKIYNTLPAGAYMGMVNYLDYSNQTFPFGNVYNNYVCKRKSFEHEREARAIVMLIPPAQPLAGVQLIGDVGVEIPVDLNTVIEKVFVNPLCAGWFEDCVREVTAAYTVQLPVAKSSLAASPLF